MTVAVCCKHCTLACTKEYFNYTESHFLLFSNGSSETSPAADCCLLRVFVFHSLPYAAELSTVFPVWLALQMLHVEKPVQRGEWEQTIPVARQEF